MGPKRFYRSVTERKIAGVAGGLAEYFDADPLFFRLLFVVLTLAGGGGVLIYLILWIITPENPAPYVFSPGFGKPAGSSEGDQTGDSNGNAETVNDPRPVTEYPEKPAGPKGSLTGGMVLITIGVLFLAAKIVPWIYIQDLWPVVLIVAGLAMLVNAISKRNQSSNLS